MYDTIKIMTKIITTTDMNDWLLKDGRGIKLIGDYINDRTKVEFKCLNDEHPSWHSTPNNIKGGNGCPRCSPSAKKTTESLRDWLLTDERGITLESEYLGHHKKSLFKCNNIDHAAWYATPCHIKNGKGCPECAKSGFKSNKSAWSYVLLFDGYIKYGITNNLQQRLWAHKHNNGDFTMVMSEYHKDGKLALEWENHIKRTHGGRYVTKEQCPDGYTETLPINLLEYLIK
jgi:hypothetical protein